jgi:uncharacterized membrane protein
MSKKRLPKRSPEDHLQDLERIDKKISTIKLKLVDHAPAPYSLKDVVRAFFGSLLVGLTFLHKGALIQGAQHLSIIHLVAIAGLSVIVVSAETYYLGYRKVIDKRERPPGQFIFKRVLTFASVAFLVSVGLVFLFALNEQLTSVYELWSIIIALCMPCMLGACLGDMVKKY